MCGISGIIYKHKKADNKEIDLMIKALNHRGPDAHGSYLYQNLALGNNRLAIIDLDQRSDQPMHAFGNQITFNGAIYNYLELKVQLEQEGYEFKTASDTEVILAAYKKWGQNCVDHFNGMWAFAILDQIKNELFCSRDRFGIKPFYYFENEHCISFASEIKAFTKLDHWSPKINTPKVIEYLAYGLQDHTIETMYDQVYQLSPGENLIIDIEHNTYKRSQYFEHKIIHEQLKEDLATQQIKAELTRAINWRMRADVRIGSCLSGGIDSSAIVCTLKEQGHEIETFSAVYDDKDISEKEFVDVVSLKTKFKNHQIAPEPHDFVRTMKKMIYIQDEPFSSTSIFAQNKLFERAQKEGVKVMMDGQGADEIFAGYEAFIPIHLKQLNPLVKLWSMIRFGIMHIGEIGKLKTRYLNKQKKQNQKLPSIIKFTNTLHIVIAATPTIKQKTIQLLSGMGLRALLHYEDRNSMHHSIESRLPFLDDTLVGKSLNIPDGLKIKNGVRKYILRKSMSNILPEKILNRHAKLGFETPHHRWINENTDDIKQMIRKNLSTCDFIDLDQLDRVKDLNLLFRIFLFALWSECFDLRFC